MRVRVDLGAMDERLLDQMKELFARSPGAVPDRLRSAGPGRRGGHAARRTSACGSMSELVDKVREMCGADAVEVVR